MCCVYSWRQVQVPIIWLPKGLNELDINIQNDDHETPLILADCLGEDSIVQFLSRVAANIDLLQFAQHQGLSRAQ